MYDISIWFKYLPTSFCCRSCIRNRSVVMGFMFECLYINKHVHQYPVKNVLFLQSHKFILKMVRSVLAKEGKFNWLRFHAFSPHNNIFLSIKLPSTKHSYSYSSTLYKCLWNNCIPQTLRNKKIWWQHYCRYKWIVPLNIIIPMLWMENWMA